MMRRSGKGFVFLVLALALFSACSQPPGRRSVLGGLDAAEQEQAALDYQRILSLRDIGDAEATWDAGLAHLERWPGSESEPHVLLITANAAAATDRTRARQRLLDLLVRDYPKNVWAVEGWSALAEFHADRGDWFGEAHALAGFDESAAPQDPRREPGRERLMALMETKLSVEEIDELVQEWPNSALSSTGSWLAAHKLYEDGHDPEDVASRLESFLREYPESVFVDDARAVLADLSQEYGHVPDPGVAGGRSDRIGLLVPLVGDYAALGQAMFDGAMLAVEEYNRERDGNLVLVSRGTRGDAVVAVEMARELVGSEQVIAVVGALLSSPTIAVATLCQERGVPMVSPTATKETIGEIGNYIFQTNLTKAVETRMLARAAVLGLRRERFAILHPDTDDGRAIAENFRQELEHAGGRVVASAAFDPRGTDFAVPIIKLRSAAPEALFIPATPTQMRLIAPQLTFHDLRAELFGPSTWNNGLLLREAGASMEQAVMPSDVAMIPESLRVRFEELWRRRFPDTPSSPFALKTYMAVHRLIVALGDGRASTRQRLLERLSDGMAGAGGADEGVSPMRVVLHGELGALPSGMLPGLVMPVPGDDLLQSSGPDED